MINSINLQIAIEYLYEGTSYSKLETKFFQAKQNNHGGRVGSLLNKLGIKSQHIAKSVYVVRTYPEKRENRGGSDRYCRITSWKASRVRITT